MKFHIILAGESNCELFAQATFAANYLSQKLPDFYYERIEKSTSEWKTWLSRTNKKYKWNHSNSPLIWKELIIKGSKPYYIGSTADFWDYCRSYYGFDSVLSLNKIDNLVKNNVQFKEKVESEKQFLKNQKNIENVPDKETGVANFNLCISGAGDPLTVYLLSELFEMCTGDQNISSIYLYDGNGNASLMEKLELDSNYVETSVPFVVKYINNVENILDHTDLLIVMDHLDFKEEETIGHWLHANKQIMRKLAETINVTDSSELKIILPNLGPACYNATCLVDFLTNVNKNNVVVATADLGLEIIHEIAKITEIPIRNIYCPPVWGFVGINHLVDVKNTIHKYHCFEPYERCLKVKNSSLKIGSLTPEIRTLEYLLHGDETLWLKISEKKNEAENIQLPLNKARAVANIIRLWLFGSGPDDVTSLGILCDGSFGLQFNGIFSQPAKLKNGMWKPASKFMLPKDPYLKLPYLYEIAKMTQKIEHNAFASVANFYELKMTAQKKLSLDIRRPDNLFY